MTNGSVFKDDWSLGASSFEGWKTEAFTIRVIDEGGSSIVKKVKLLVGKIGEMEETLIEKMRKGLEDFFLFERTNKDEIGFLGMIEKRKKRANDSLRIFARFDVAYH